MTALAEALRSVRAALIEEITPRPGRPRIYGRPHAYPRARSMPRFSRTGERLPGSVRIPPDCPRPVRGRCECPPDGSWHPTAGVILADATARDAVGVPGDRVPGGSAEATIWVTAVHDLGPDGLWRCRRPVFCALQHLRGASTRRWAIAVRLLRGDHLATVWGATGAPADPHREALGIIRTLDRWADDERRAEYEHRPHQWWDPPRRPRETEKSDAQQTAEANGGSDAAAKRVDSARPGDTILGEAEANPPSGESAGPAHRLGRGRQVEQPSGMSGARAAAGHPVSCEASRD